MPSPKEGVFAKSDVIKKNNCSSVFLCLVTKILSVCFKNPEIEKRTGG